MTEMRLQADRYIFWGYLGLLLYAPLPLGSKVIFAWSALVVIACILGIAWLLLYMLGLAALSQGFREARVMHLIWGIWLLWLLVQLTPVPSGLLEAISPHSAAWQSRVSALLASPDSAWGTITLSPWATQSGFFKSIAYIAVFMLTLLLVNTRRRLKLLVWVLVLSGLFQALYGSLSVLTGSGGTVFPEDVYTHSLATGSFTNRNHLAGYLVMCLSLGIGLMLGMASDERHSGWRSWVRGWLKILISARLGLRLILVIMVIALVMTHSRMGNGSFFAGMLGTAVIALFLMRGMKRSMSILIVSLIVIDILVIGAWFGIDKVAQRLEQTVTVETVPSPEYAGSGQVIVNISDQGRAQLNRDTFNYWKSYWLAGSGLGSFQYVYPQFRGSDVVGHHVYAHNDYLQFLVETGLLGFALLAMAMLYLLWNALDALRKRHDPLMRGMAFGALMSMSAMLLHSAVDFNLQIPSNAMTFMVVLAIAILSRYMRELQGTRNAI